MRKKRHAGLAVFAAPDFLEGGFKRPFGAVGVFPDDPAFRGEESVS